MISTTGKAVTVARLLTIMNGSNHAMVVRLLLWLVDHDEEFREQFGRLLQCRFGFEDICCFDRAEEDLDNACAVPQNYPIDLSVPPIPLTVAPTNDYSEGRVEIATLTHGQVYALAFQQEAMRACI